MYILTPIMVKAPYKVLFVPAQVVFDKWMETQPWNPKARYIYTWQPPQHDFR